MINTIIIHILDFNLIINIVYFILFQMEKHQKNQYLWLPFWGKF